MNELRQYTSTERKAMPLYSGVLRYFPDALMAIARLSKAGNDKHNPGEPLHWARGKSTDQMDCAARHMLTPDVVDEETGEAELVAAAWRILAELQLAEEKRLVAAGIKPLSGVVPDEGLYGPSASGRIATWASFHCSRKHTWRAFFEDGRVPLGCPTCTGKAVRVQLPGKPWRHL